MPVVTYLAQISDTWQSFDHLSDILPTRSDDENDIGPSSRPVVQPAGPDLSFKTVVVLGQSRVTVQEFSPCVSQRGGAAFLVSRHLATTFP